MATQRSPGGALMGFFDLFKGPKVKRVSAPQAHDIIQQGAQFIDVRNRGEYNTGHAQGAKNIALHALPNNIKNLDPAKPVVCICASGMRSGRAAQLLVKNGFQDVYNVGGGSTAWHGHGLPWE